MEIDLLLIIIPAVLAGAVTGHLIGKAAGFPRKTLHVSIISAGIAAIITLFFGLSWKALYVFAVFCILLAISAIDFRTMEIPDELTIALIPFAVIAAFDGSPVLYRIIGFFIISVPMLIMSLIVESAFGGGDIKLIAVCGFMLGMAGTLLAMFIAIMLGGTAASILLITRKKNKGMHIPFGPYICAGVLTALLAGDNIITWYLSLYGF